jgi:hypothetical protein
MLCERDGAVDLITLRCGNKLQDTQSISQLLSKSGRKDGEGRKGWDWYSEGISRIFVAAEKWRCRFLVLLVSFPLLFCCFSSDLNLFLLFPYRSNTKVCLPGGSNKGPGREESLVRFFLPKGCLVYYSVSVAVACVYTLLVSDGAVEGISAEV